MTDACNQKTDSLSYSSNFFVSSKFSVKYTNDIIIINRTVSSEHQLNSNNLGERQSIINIQKKFQRFDRVSSILVVISAFFILLNLPYIIAWFAFFIPMKQGTLTADEIKFRFGFVNLTEILHLTNFSINFFFYYLGTSWGFKNFSLCQRRNKTPSNI